MGLPVLILGETGSGKSYSIKNFNVNEVGIFSVEKPFLPFKKDFKILKHATYSDIEKVFKDPQLKTYIIDDSQYLLVNEMFDKAKDAGYGKFTDIALHFRNLIHYINHSMPDDVIVYIVMHEEETDFGGVKLKTIGKLLDQKVCLEGMVTIALRCMSDGRRHYFRTQSDGTDVSKSPEEMFDLEIDNDLKMVDETIREYWNLGGNSND